MQMNKQGAIRYLGIVCFVMSACVHGNSYMFQLFTFPDNIPAHQDGWELKGSLLVTTTTSGSMYKKGLKMVNLKIVNQAGDVLLDVDRSYNSSAIEGRFNWKQKNRLIVTLIELPHASSKNDDNAVSSENILDVLIVELDANSNMFNIE